MNQDTAHKDTSALWLLPLAAGLLPLTGVTAAFWLAVEQGQFASCMPLFDGCVSISRAARHDLPNYIFRALLLPAATLQALVWLLTGNWLRRLGAPRDRLLSLLPWIGVTAAICLVLYGTFLGTEGSGYRLMRRYGVYIYFGFTCIAMLIVAGSAQRVAAGTGRLRHVAMTLYALTAALPLLGILNSMAPLYLSDASRISALGNITEWWGGAIFTVFFILLAGLWRASGFSIRLSIYGTRDD